MKKRSVVKIISGIFIFTSMFSTGVFAKNLNTKKAQVNNKNTIIQLKSVQAGDGFEDLSNLELILKDKKIVSVGEATHGTKEFSQVKHRMFEFLVEKMGYRVFAMEIGFDNAQLVNEYILCGKGNLNDVVKKSMFEIWQTKEFADMVQWMRDYNKNPNHKTKIKFYGFDMQSISENKKRFLNYLNKVDISAFEKCNKIFNQFDRENIGTFNEDKVTKIKKEVMELENNFKLSRKSYTLKSSKAEYEMMEQHLTTIYQCLELNSPKNRGANYCGVNFRDKCMAENVRWILNHEKQFGNDKIMLWAHNGHVAKKMQGYVCMGEYLKSMYKDNMYVIGLEFYKGTFRAYGFDSNENMKRNLEKFYVGSFPGISLGDQLHDLNIPICFVDFKNWSNKAKISHMIGAGYSPMSFLGNNFYYDPTKLYDGVIFIDKTSASVPIEG